MENKLKKTKRAKDIKNLYYNTFMMYVMKACGYIFPLLTLPYLTKTLGPSAYGIVTVAIAYMEFFQTSVDFGYLLSATRDCSLNRDDPQKLSNIISSVIHGKLLIFLLGLIVLIFINSYIEELQGKQAYLFLSYAVVFLSIFVPDYFFRGIERMSYITYRTIVSKAIYTLLIFVFVKGPDDYMLIPVFNIISTLVVVVWSWYFLKKHYYITLSHVSLSEVFKSLKGSAPFFLSRIASNIYTAGNTALLNLSGFSDASLGQYGTANSLITAGRGLFSPISDSLYPYMVVKKNFKLLKKTLLILMPIITVGVIVLYFISDWFVMLFAGAKYADAVPIFQAMLPLLFITLPVYIMGYPTLGAMNMMKEANLSVIYASGFHIIGMAVLVLTGSLGFISISLLTFLTECVVLTLRIIYCIKGTKRLKAEMEEKLKNESIALEENNQ